MKILKFYIGGLSVLFYISIFGQVSIDRSIVLTGSGTDAKITGIQNVTESQDAVSVQSMQNGGLIYAADLGSANTYVVALSPAVSAYVPGMIVNFQAANANTGASTVNVNGLGPININKQVTNSLAANDILANQLVSVMFDGNNFQMLSQSGNSSALAASNGVNATNGDVELGGALTKNTDVPLNSKNLTFSGSGNIGIGTNPPNTVLDLNGAISARPSTTVNVTSNNTAITVGNYSYIKLTSNATDPSTRIITLSNGLQDGQLLTVYNYSTPTAALGVRLVNTGNVSLLRQYLDIYGGQFISFLWDGSSWVQEGMRADPGTQTFSYTGADQSFLVPDGVYSISVKLWGAGGGGNSNSTAGGGGAFLSGTLYVTPGTTYTVVVGQGGANSTSTMYGGGGIGYGSAGYGGGGRSAISLGGADIVTAGGGGAGGYAKNINGTGSGGGGGATTGTTGLYGYSSSCAEGGGGGTTSGGGAGGVSVACGGQNSDQGGAGTQYEGGNISHTTSGIGYWGGAGGGGYYGGGAGGNYYGGGGGGGASYYPVTGFSLISNVAGNSETLGVKPCNTQNPGNTTDSNYQSGIGVSGCSSQAGGNGLVVISW